jgi:invasion protein IalB
MLRGLLIVASIVALGAAAFFAAQSLPGLGTAQEANSYGDWAVRCVERPNLDPCDVVQSLSDQKAKKSIMQISYAYNPGKDLYAAQIMLPLGFMIQAGVLIRLDGKTDINDYPFTRCEPEGCFVEKIIKGKDLESIRNAKEGVIVVMNRDGKAVGFPFSLKGFGDAVDSMTRRNKKAAGG